MSREPEENLKIEFAPTRVIVLSGKVIAARDFRPVNKVEEPPIFSPPEIVRAADDFSLSLTSLTTVVTTADFSGAADKLADTAAATRIQIEFFIMLVNWINF
ncbi:MAG: hypothetical protein NWR51_03030 [Akkermansiaceae bacterium]|nr:hypothetical protein [Akkermansiaceae bacterium]MDP4846212.1 hypothetical protein [Akkermansiaceae bacterium]